MARAVATSINAGKTFSFRSAARFTATSAPSTAGLLRFFLAEELAELFFLRAFVDLQDIDRLLLVFFECVHADDDLFPFVDRFLVGEGRVGNFAAEEAGIDGGQHAALVVDLLEVVFGLLDASAR